MRAHMDSEYASHVLTMAREVDLIVQDLLAQLQMKDRSVHLRRGADLGIEIVVDGQVYQELEHITNGDIRDIVQASVDEWLARQAEKSPRGEPRLHQSDRARVAQPSASDARETVGDPRQVSSPFRDRIRLPYAVNPAIGMVVVLSRLSLLVGGVILATRGMLVAGVATIALVTPLLFVWHALRMQCPRCERLSAGKVVWKGSTESEAISIYDCRYCGYRWDKWEDIEHNDRTW